MKHIIVIGCILLSVIGCKSANSQSSIPPDYDFPKYKMVHDSLLKISVPFDTLVQISRENILTPVNNKNRNYSVEKLVLPTGGTFIFETSDNARTRQVLQALSGKISPVEMLVELRNIEGYIKFWRNSFPNDWLKREDVPALLELSGVPVLTPDFKLIRDSPIPPDEVVLIHNRDKAQKRNYGGYSYTKTPMGVNALALISGYLNKGQFPGSTSITPEKVKEWYDSGKPREEFRWLPRIQHVSYMLLRWRSAVGS